MEGFSEDFGALRDPAVTCKEEIISVVFRGMELIAAVKHKLENGLTRYSSLVQNSKLIPFLSLGVTSSCKFLVHASIQIIAEGSKAPGFASRTLGETLTQHNSSRTSASTTTTVPLSSQISTSSAGRQFGQDITNSAPRGGTITPSLPVPPVSMLTDRLDKGLDIKDAKVSEIMGFYEHKLSAVMGREKHIQDLLETKSTTLAQTERLLAEFRCRQVRRLTLTLCQVLQTCKQTGHSRCIKLIKRISLRAFFQSIPTPKKPS